MHMTDGTVVTVNTHSLIATTVARVSKSSLGLLLSCCRILVVHAYLFKFLHNVTSLLMNSNKPIIIGSAQAKPIGYGFIRHPGQRVTA